MKAIPPLLGAALCTLAIGSAPAQSYPAKSVRFICPLPAGGDVDIVTRIVANKLTAQWAQQVVVDNRPGASGTIGAALVAKSSADGYTLLMGGVGNIVIAPALYKTLPYDGMRAFAPVSLIGTTPMVLVVHPSLPARSVREFVAYAKANPGKITFASAGVGSTIQLPMELLKSQTGANVVHVPYKGAAPAIADLLGGQVASMFAGIPALQANIKAGKLRALGVTALKRSSQLPDVPTIAESGFPGFEVLFWFGTFAPAGTPQAIVTKISADIATALHSPDVQRRLTEDGVDIAASTSEQLAALLNAESLKWNKVIRDAGITAD